MGLIGLALLLIGVLAMFIFGIWMLVLAFKDSILLGVLSLIIPFVIIYAVVKTWPASKTPLIGYLVGMAITFLGTLIGGAASGTVTVSG